MPGLSTHTHVPRCVNFEELCAHLADGRPIAECLPTNVADALKDAPAPRVLVDFAGRDSVAAALAWLADHEVGTYIPVGDVVPTRYGDWSIYEDNWQQMRNQLAQRHPAVRFTPWFVVEDTQMWRLLNARYLNQLIAAFGFFTPCLGCHLHFYAMRAVLGHALGAEVLISGEKELHGTRRKANQTPEAVEGYRSFSHAHGIRQHFPIYTLEGEAEMERLLAFEWKEGERQLRCVMSGNDRAADGSLAMRPDQIRAYMSGFAVPLATTIIELRRASVGPDELQLRVDAEVQRLLAEVNGD